MNVELEYVYRDAGNYKNFGTVIFCNRKSYSIEWLEKEIEKWLIDREFFIAEQIKVPTLYFTDYAYSPALDHEWHQFLGIRLSEEKSNDTYNRDIDDMLHLLQRLGMNRI